jgi:hypothetical protein
MFLLSALSKVNIDPRANMRHVLIFRRNIKNELEKFEVDATRENFALVPHDVIYVPHLRKNYQLQNVISTVAQFFGGSGSLVNTAHNIRYFSNGTGFSNFNSNVGTNNR